jgi:hypothetical protein
MLAVGVGTLSCRRCPETVDWRTDKVSYSVLIPAARMIFTHCNICLYARSEDPRGNIVRQDWNQPRNESGQCITKSESELTSRLTGSGALLPGGCIIGKRSDGRVATSLMTWSTEGNAGPLVPPRCRNSNSDVRLS